ncbi:MAG: hypothetical protein LBN95_05510 [Prevotellaceae bacterium]|jgi:hypothetical protein|nr:hypothetical protein [Prevotellaceae bacterium]
MKKSVLSLVFILALCPVFADCGGDSTWTKYFDGTFFTTTKTVVVSDFATAHKVENNFINQFNNDFTQLFLWAFKDIGESNDKDKNAFLVEIKSTKLDKMSGVTTITADVIVPGIKRFKDVIIKAKIVETSDKQTFSNVFIDVHYSNMLLKKAYGTVFVEKCSDSEVKISATVSVRFGWFFNIFVTKKVYKDVVEWRLAKILQNIKMVIQ